MANNIGGNINQLFRPSEANSRNGPVSGAKSRSQSQKSSTTKEKASATEKLFGESAKLEFSPEAEMFGKVADMLQKKYDNADVFVAGPDDDLSQIGGDLEYSIILSEDEMKLLASDDPKDKKAKDKLMGQIDDAMKSISDMSQKIGENTDETDDIANFGIKVDNNGKINFFADINGNSYSDTSMDSLINSIVGSKAK